MPIRLKQTAPQSDDQLSIPIDFWLSAFTPQIGLLICMNSWEPININDNARPFPDNKVPSTECMSCNLNNVCIPAVLNPNEIDIFQRIVSDQGAFKKGQYLFRYGDSFETLFVVRSGVVKTYIDSESGSEHVTGFYLPGDIVGLESKNVSHHQNAAVALERSTLCAIPTAQFDDLILEIPALRFHLFTLMSMKIKESQQLSLMMSHYTAEQRIIYFLLSLSNHYRRRNLSPTRFRLPTSRTEIARYLGLAKETVSRSLHQLTKEKLITIDGREINLLNRDPLADRLNRPSS